MKKQIAPIVVLLALLIDLSYCQEKSSQEIEIKNSLEKGKWALQFEVGMDFTLKSFDGMLFSLKYQLSKRSAIRFGAGVGTLTRDITLEDTSFSYPGKRNELGLSLIGYYLFCPNPASEINVFFGIGPKAFYYHTTDEYTSDDYPHFKRTRKYDSWNAGLTGALGAEWFASESISLFGEYVFYVQYGKYVDLDEIINTDGSLIDRRKFDSEVLEFRGSTARLGISVYFDFPF